MKCRVIVCALILTVSAGAAAQATQKKRSPAKPEVQAAPAKQEVQSPRAYPDPFDFKGIRLGMTLSDFRAAPMPFESTKNVKVACTGDSGTEYMPLDVYGDDKAVGVVKCRWVRADSKWGAPVLPQITERTVNSAMLQFLAKPEDPEPRLYAMRFSVHTRGYENIKAALTSRFGPPIRTEPSTVQNRMGAVFDSETAIWANATGEIIAVKVAGDINTMGLVYSLSEHANYYEAKKSELRAKRGPGL